MFQLELHDDPKAFAGAVGAWLAEREAENALLLGLLEALMREPPAAPPVMLQATNDGQTAFAVLDGGHNLVISRGPEGAVEAAAAKLSALPLEPPGVVGPVDDAQRFAEAWARARRCDHFLAFDQRIYELTEVLTPPLVPGAMRAVALADLELVASWGAAFDVETLAAHDQRALDQVRDLLARRIGKRDLFGWEVEGQLVSLAGLARPTNRTISINSVYTPPAQRRRGFATALVAAVSGEGLARGKERCVLYTDLANPTSNAIYQKVGYRPVCDSRQYGFRPRAA